LKLLLPLFEMTQNLNERPKLEDLSRKILNLIIRETGAEFVSFSFENGMSDFTFWDLKTAIPGNEPQVHGLVKRFEEKYEALDAPLLLSVFSDIEENDRMFLEVCGFSSIMIYPLKSRYQSRGFLISGKNSTRNPFYLRDKELFSIIGHQLAVVLENYGLIEELENAHFESLKALASAIEAKDTYTSGHCDRLVDYSLLLADKLNLNHEERKQLRYGAALHDIGKIGIKDAILGKPGKLTPSEYEEMKLHPKIGAEILNKIKFLRPVAPIIYHHQECYDGSGYPEGLSGNSIPIGSRIVAILDTFDAMTTNRPYRKALPVDTAINELIRYSGRQFDPELVAAFIEVIQEKF